MDRSGWRTDLLWRISQQRRSYAGDMHDLLRGERLYPGGNGVRFSMVRLDSFPSPLPFPLPLILLSFPLESLDVLLLSAPITPFISLNR
jgi:hypothetical protein